MNIYYNCLVPPLGPTVGICQWKNGYEPDMLRFFLKKQRRVCRRHTWKADGCHVEKDKIGALILPLPTRGHVSPRLKKNLKRFRGGNIPRLPPPPSLHNPPIFPSFQRNRRCASRSSATPPPSLPPCRRHVRTRQRCPMGGRRRRRRRRRGAASARRRATPVRSVAGSTERVTGGSPGGGRDDGGDDREKGAVHGGCGEFTVAAYVRYVQIAISIHLCSLSMDCAPFSV